MTLTGPAFLASVVVVTVGAFATAVWFWPRLAAGGAPRVAARTVVLAGINALVLLTAAVALNDKYLFYADWTDLFGAVHTTTAVHYVHLGATTSLAERERGAPAYVVPASLRVPPGASPRNRVLRFTVSGPRSGVTGGVLVALPRQYFAPGRHVSRFPVLEAFHGLPGTADQWVDSMDLPGALDLAVAQGRVAPAIVVMPTIQVPPSRDTECVNGSPSDPQLETWLTEDVPDWVAHTFRVRRDVTSWASIGFSVGGWCAAMAAMLHPHHFSAAVVMGGYFRPEFSNWRPFTARSAQGRRYDLVRLAGHAPPPVALWVETSHSDPVSYPSTAAFATKVRPPLSVDLVVLNHAGHRIGLWKSYLGAVLDWLGTTVPGFHPAA